MSETPNSIEIDEASAERSHRKLNCAPEAFYQSRAAQIMENETVKEAIRFGSQWI